MPTEQENSPQATSANILESFTPTVFVSSRLYTEGQFTPIWKPFKFGGSCLTIVPFCGLFPQRFKTVQLFKFV